MSFIGIKISVGEGKVMATACGQTKNLRKKSKKERISTRFKVQKGSPVYITCAIWC